MHTCGQGSFQSDVAVITDAGLDPQSGSEEEVMAAVAAVTVELERRE